MEVEGQQIEMPAPDENLKFKHHLKNLRCPFLYAEFECMIEEIEKPEDDEIKKYKYQKHKPCGFTSNFVYAIDNNTYTFFV